MDNKPHAKLLESLDEHAWSRILNQLDQHTAREVVAAAKSEVEVTLATNQLLDSIGLAGASRESRLNVADLLGPLTLERRRALAAAVTAARAQGDDQ
jgi:hypothetical protein